MKIKLLASYPEIPDSCLSSQFTLRTSLFRNMTRSSRQMCGAELQMCGAPCGLCGARFAADHMASHPEPFEGCVFDDGFVEAHCSVTPHTQHVEFSVRLP